MVALFSTVLKLIVIFIGSGIASLVAYWIVQQTIIITKLIMLENKKTINEKHLVVIKTKQVTEDVGFYEAVLPSGRSIKIFSSNSGMRII